MITLLLIGYGILLTQVNLVVYPEFFIFPYLRQQGLIPYLQIIDQHAPFLFFWPNVSYGLIKVFWILMILWQAIWVIRISRVKSSFVLFSLWQVMFYGNKLWLDTFLPSLFLPGLYLITSGNLFLAGIILGLSVYIKQTSLILIGVISLWLFFKKKKNIISFLSGIGISLLPLSSWLLNDNLLWEFKRWTFDFNIFYYANQAKIIPGLKDKILLVLILVFLLNTKKSFLKLWSLVLFALTGPRFDWIHFHTLGPLLALSYYSLSRKLSKVVYLITIAIFCIYFIVKGGYQKDFYSLEPEFINLSQKIASLNLSDRSSVFLLGVQPHIYYMANLLPPSNYFFYQLPWYLRLLEDKQIEVLKNSKTKFVIFDPNASVDMINISIYAKALVTYVKDNYELVDNYARYEIYRRKN